MLKSFVAGIAIFLAGLFGTHQVQPAAPVYTYPPAAHAVIQEAPGTVHPTVPAATPPTSQPTTIINQPVVERVVNPSTVSDAVTHTELQVALNALRSQFFTTQSSGSLTSSSPVPYSLFQRQTDSLFDSIAKSQRIDQLSGTDLSDITVDGVSGLTDADIPDGITASNYLALTGGTLSGDVSLTNATSTNFFATLGHFTTGIIDTLTAAAATITNLIATTIIGTNATFTNATSTNLYSTTASSTNLSTSNFSLGSLTGFLKATAGAVTSALVNLTSDVTGTLPLANGGTGSTNAAAAQAALGTNGKPFVTVTCSSNTRAPIADYVATGTADDVVINQAIASLGTGGGTVYLFECQYSASSSINIANNVTLMGAGQGATVIILKPNDTNSIILASNTSNWSVHDLTLDGGTNTSGAGTGNQPASTNDQLQDDISVSGGSNFHIYNIEVRNAAYHGIFVAGTASNFSIDHVFGEGNGFRCIHVHGTDSSAINYYNVSDNTCHGDGTNAGASAAGGASTSANSGIYVAFANVHHVTITNNTVYNEPGMCFDLSGNYPTGGNNVAADQIIFSSNHAVNCVTSSAAGAAGAAAILISRAISKVTASDNTISTTTNGAPGLSINNSSTPALSGITWEGGYITGAAADCVNIRASNSFAVSNIVIQGVQIDTCGGRGINISSGSGASVDKVIIANNTIQNATTQGIFVDGSSPANITNLTISQNAISLNLAGGVYISYANHYIVSGNTLIDNGPATSGLVQQLTINNSPNGNIVNNQIHDSNRSQQAPAIGTNSASSNLNIKDNQLQSRGGGGGTVLFVQGPNAYVSGNIGNGNMNLNGATGYAFGNEFTFAPTNVGSNMILFTFATSTGNIGIGTTTPTTALQVNGVITPNADNTSSLGNATYRWSAVYAANGTIQTSDQRLKSNITDLNYGLSDVLKLRPVSFNWTAQPQQGTQLGFIAQEVQPLFPETVNVGDDANHTLGLTYTEFVPIVVKAVQQLDQKLTDLANIVAGFADFFTTKELTFTRAAGDEIDVQKLCVGSTCVTEDQFKAMLANAGSAGASSGSIDSGRGSSDSPTSDASATPDTTPPTITINGNNPATVNVGDTYADLGATVTDNVEQNLGLKYFLNGALVSNIVIDTSAAATDTIDYVAADNAGNTSTSTRSVIISPDVQADTASTTTQ